jgi:hypothetical protein
MLWITAFSGFPDHASANRWYGRFWCNAAALVLPTKVSERFNVWADGWPYHAYVRHILEVFGLRSEVAKIV